MNNFNFKSYDTIKQTISYCEVDKCPAVIKLREQLEAYKMEAEEGKEINAELKAENDELKQVLKDGGLHNLTLMTEQRVLLQTLAEIKEIAELKQKQSVFVGETVFEQILQKISECEVGDEK